MAGVVAFLVLATVIDLPARLALTAPEPAAPQGQLSNLVTDENQQLDRCVPGAAALARCGKAPAFRGGEWFNTSGRPPTVDALRGGVVLVDFFSGSCINCRRDARYLRAWDARYRAGGLRIVGVHSPEFAFEKKSGHVADVVRSLSLRFPVLRDDALSTGSAYRSRFLPAKYLIDASGTVRAISFGEGGYARIEKQIRALLANASRAELPGPVGILDDAGTPATGTTRQINVGDSRGTGYDAERDAVVGKEASYILAPGQADDTYSLGGRWTVDTQLATSGKRARSRVSFRARTVYQLVGGRGTITVRSEGLADRRIRVSGPPRLRRILGSAESERQTITVGYTAGLDVYAFSFG